MATKFHHALVKSLAAAGLAIADHPTEAGMAQITMEGVEIIAGPVADAKDLAAKAKKIVEAEDFDLDALRQEGDEGGEGEGNEIDADAADAEAQEADGGGDSPLAKTMRKYRTKYKEIGANDSNGDAVAQAMRAAITKLGDKKGEAAMDRAALERIADANDLPLQDSGNNGRDRMTLGNMLRGRLRQGFDLQIGDTTIPATEEAKAKRAAAHEKDRAKAEAKAAPKQTKEEKAAKAKARREAAKAKKAEAKEAEAAQIAA